MNGKITNDGPSASLFKRTEALTLRVLEIDEIEYRFVICDTCHSRHMPTGQRQFVKMPFDEDSVLCYECHR